MKRLLIISPHFPPVNAPDHQRVRMALPYYAQNGWEATVLTVNPAGISSPHDDSLIKTIPPNTNLEEVHCLSPRWGIIPGLGTLSWRAYYALRTRGDQLLQDQSFDLIFFSTTQFGVLSLGPYWKKKWNVPFCVDLQDPWINTFYAENHIRPPGGRIKFFIQQTLAKQQSRKVISEAAGIVTVSEAYITHFTQKGLCHESCQKLILPFPYAASDWDIAKQQPSVVFPWSNITRGIHWVYPGRGGNDLHPFLKVLFRALAHCIEEAPEKWSTLHLWFIGTQYGKQNFRTYPIKELAEQQGFQNAHEIPERIPYLDTLQIIQAADGLLIPGSIDQNYNPSKLLPLLSSQKPMFVTAPSRSSCASQMRHYSPNELFTYPLPFKEQETLALLRQSINQIILTHPKKREMPASFHDREAEVSTGELCTFFRKCLKDEK